MIVALYIFLQGPANMERSFLCSVFLFKRSQKASEDINWLSSISFFMTRLGVTVILSLFLEIHNGMTTNVDEGTYCMRRRLHPLHIRYLNKVGIARKSCWDVSGNRFGVMWRAVDLIKKSRGITFTVSREVKWHLCLEWFANMVENMEVRTE